MTKTYATSTNHIEGKVIVLFLLFLLALYLFHSVGLTGFAAICVLPAIVLFVFLALKHQNSLFWYVFFMNYFVMGLQRYGYIPLQVTIVTVLPQVLLIIAFIIHPRKCKNTLWTPMLFAILLWTTYLIIQVFNETCGLPLSIPNWLTNLNFYSFYFILAHVLISKIINTPKNIMRFIRLWAIFSLIATYWAWRQKTFGWDQTEWRWLMSGASRTHLIGGSIRYFSFFSDAANFGCNMGASAAIFYVLALTSKLKKDKYLFLITGIACTYSFFASGTRSGLVCFIVGIFLYVFLAKSVRLTVTVLIIGGAFIFTMAFTEFGESNMQIRRMRSAFNTNDASLNVRELNKQALKKYLQDAPFGMGINIDEGRIPKFNKFKIVYETSNDSTYVFFWQRTGIIGVYVFATMNIIILLGGCMIAYFKLKNKACKGIAAALCCGFLAIQAGGYANHILMQYPNLFLFYGGMAIVYLLPTIEGDYIVYEENKVAEVEEKKLLKQEKRKKSRVKTWLTWK
ncbi:O-antigen ligase like membrane protein [Prevotella communis]|uniref:O-antigen ligase like membrane protein n=1 Tax=Prevotella communis TaxID=2913614 RepID=A0A1H0IC88_9BACT|nr:O-antigen ligase family protein [Prevotella communis]SDO29079.1 O-antigen ligase like membrane protein [Prevotella communis]